jgi:hypothetical protein
MPTASKTLARPSKTPARAPLKLPPAKKAVVTLTTNKNISDTHDIAPRKAAMATRRKTELPIQSFISPEQRRRYIEEAAYFIAERKGFKGNDELADWTQAEREIDALLAAGRLNS